MSDANVAEIRKKTPVNDIAKKVMAYHKKMKRISHILSEYYKEHPEVEEKISIDENELLAFYIDKPAITRLVGISLLEGFDTFGVFFGLDHIGNMESRTVPANGKQVTGCFLGLDKERNILPQHFGIFPSGKPITASSGEDDPTDGDAVPGEDTWPPPPDTDGPPPTGGGVAVKSKPVNCYTLANSATDLETYFKVNNKVK